MIEPRQDLELLAQHAVDVGALPRARVNPFVGRFGPLREERCPVCLHTMLAEEMTATAQSPVQGITLHASCFNAWQMIVPAEAETEALRRFDAAGVQQGKTR